jgi:hypothetical protein
MGESGMSPSTEPILQLSHALPAAEQAELIDALIAAQEQSDPQPLDAALSPEIERPCAEADANPAEGILWEVVLAEARARRSGVRPPRWLKEVMNDIGRYSEAQGLTLETLKSLLRDQ